MMRAATLDIVSTSKTQIYYKNKFFKCENTL